MLLPPDVVMRCPVEDCGKTVGPYYDHKEALAAVREHIKWRHYNLISPAVVKEDNYWKLDRTRT